MQRGLIFWVIMLVWVVFFVAVSFGYGGTYGPRASGAVELILFVLLGWQVYGPPIRG
jgi:hypothetical protein